MSGLLIERLQFVKGIDPIADMNNGTVASDVIDMGAFTRLVFVVYKGVATGGTAAGTYTVLACSDTVPSATTAIAFNYRKALGAVAAATTTGFQSTVGSSSIDLIEVREDALVATGYRYVELSIAETVNDPIVACVLVFGEPKDQRSSYATVTD